MPRLPPTLPLVHAAALVALAAACSPPPPPPVAPPAVATAAPTATAAAEPPGPAVFVPVDAPFNINPDEHAWAPNGEVVAFADQMQRVLLWDAPKNAARGVLGPFEGWPTSIAWSRDGERIAVLVGTRAHVFALRDGGRLGAVDALEGSSAAFSPDGKVLYSLAEDGHLVGHDVASGAETGKTRLDVPRSAKVHGAAISPDGARIAARIEGKPGGVAIWSVAEGHKLALREGAGAFTWADDSGSVYLHDPAATTATLRLRPGAEAEALATPAALPGAPRFAVRTLEDKMATRILTATGTPLAPPFPDKEASYQGVGVVEIVRFSPDAAELVSHRKVGVDRWDLRTGRLLGTLPIDPDFISKNARYALVTALGDPLDSVSLVDLRTGETRLTMSSPRLNVRWRSAYSDAARRLAVLGVPDGARPARWPGVAGTVRDPSAELVTIIDPETAKVERVLGEGGSPVGAVTLCADDKLVATEHLAVKKGGPTPLRVWSAADGKKVVDAPSGELQACSANATVVVVRTRLEEKKAKAGKPAAGKPTAKAAAPAKPPRRSRVDFYDTVRHARLSSIELATDWPAFDISADGSLAAIASTGDPEIIVWDVRAGKRRATLPGEARASFSAWNHAGTRLAVSTTDHEAVLWDAATGTVRPLPGATALSIHHLRWSDDDTRVLVLREGAPDPAARTTVEIFGEDGRRLDRPGKTFGIPAIAPAVAIVDEPDGPRAHYDPFGLKRVGTEIAGSIFVSWRNVGIFPLDPFGRMETSPDGKLGASAPFGMPVIFRLTDGAAIALRAFTEGDRRVGVATADDGRFTGDPEAFARLSFRRGHWLKGPLESGRDIAAERQTPNLLAEFFAGHP